MYCPFQQPTATWPSLTGFVREVDVVAHVVTGRGFEELGDSEVGQGLVVRVRSVEITGHVVGAGRVPEAETQPSGTIPL